jgi:menaquinone-dependent protoporphyrinogen oxidase
MPRLLIAYATTDGHTARIATRMVDAARAAGYGERVADVAHLADDVWTPPPDVVIVGGSVHKGRHQAALLDFVRAHRARLEGMPTGLFSVSMSQAYPEGQAESKGYVSEFLAQTGWRPNQVARLAGALLYRQYGFLKRFMMKQIARQRGGETDTSRDHVFTDWNAVDAFVRELLGAAESRLASVPSGVAQRGDRC